MLGWWLFDAVWICWNCFGIACQLLACDWPAGRGGTSECFQTKLSRKSSTKSSTCTRTTGTAGTSARTANYIWLLFLTSVLWTSNTARTVGFWTSVAEVLQRLAGRIAVPVQETFKPSNPEGEPVRLSQTSDQVEVVPCPSVTFHMFRTTPLLEHFVLVWLCKTCKSGQGHCLHSSVTWFSLTRTATFRGASRIFSLQREREREIRQ